MKKIATEQIIETMFKSRKFVSDGTKLWIHLDGYYGQRTPYETAKAVRQLFDSEQQKQIPTATIREAIERFSQLEDAQISFDDAYENVLNLENGIFDFETEKLTQRTSEHHFCHLVRFCYIERSNRSMPVFEKFISDLFPEQTQLHRDLLMQIMGYCLSGYTKAKAAFFLIGKTGSGKSTILDLMKNVIPEEQRTSLSLTKISGRFNIAKLFGSRVNFCSELAADAFKSEDIFKQITSNEMVTAEFKGSTPFQFQVKTKLLSAGNSLPDIKISEGSQALIDRLIILNFRVTIPRQQQNPYLLNELLGEKDSIFSEAVDAVMNLKADNFNFVQPLDSFEIKANLESRNRLLEDFVNECCEISPDVKVHMQNLWSAFCEYAESNLIDNHYSKQQFSSMMCMIEGVERKKFRLPGTSSLWGLVGIKLKK